MQIIKIKRYSNKLHEVCGKSCHPRGEIWWSWSYGGWIDNYLWNQYLSPLTLWVRIQLRQGVIDTTLCDKVWQWLAADQGFSPGTPVSSTNKTDCHDITEISLKVALNTTILTRAEMSQNAHRYSKFIILLKLDLNHVCTRFYLP
jgi:hypothetical protein